MMKILRVILMAWLCLLGSQMAMAGEGVLMNKHLEKLLGTWTSEQGEVTFNANRTIVYHGSRNFCAVAQGMIQISKKNLTLMLPYRFLDGKLLITDGGAVTTYSKVVEPIIAK